jgi:hypothetical protein
MIAILPRAGAFLDTKERGDAREGALWILGDPAIRAATRRFAMNLAVRNGVV